MVLGNTARSSALPALRNAVDDRFPSVRVAVVRALGQYNDPEVIQLLLDASSSDERDVGVRIAAIETLGQMKQYDTDAIVASLVGIARADKSPDVRIAAIRALASAESEF